MTRNTVIESALENVTTYQVAIAKPKLLRECLRYGQGFYSPEVIAQAIDDYERLIPTQDQRLTTNKILNREQFILKSANDGQRTQVPLSTKEDVQAIAQEKGLNEGQTQGLQHLAMNSDQVILVQGDAGVGKTYTLNAFRELLPAKTQQELIGLAPSAAAAQVLQYEAELPSRTVDSYLHTSNERLKRDQILVVDEAGMLSHYQMSQLLQKSQDLNNRLILVGDIKQLSSIESGAPFRLLQERSQLPTVSLNENLRQVTPELQQAVNLAADQQMTHALQVLDLHGAIAEVKDEAERLRTVAQQYLDRPHERQVQTLILCDTNSDRRVITEQIRSTYLEQGKLGQASQTIPILQPKRLDEQAIAQSYNYELGDVIRFRNQSQKFPSHYYRVSQVESDRLQLIDPKGETVELPLNKFRDREVFRCHEIEIREGDRLRFTRNQRDWNQINGQLFTVEGFNPDGSVQINSRGKSYGVSFEQMAHTDYAYCRTVYGAQGWTAKEAIWAPGQRPGKEQTYVALSRAKENLEIITLDRQGMGLSIQQTQAQENVLDLVQSVKPSPPTIQPEQLKTVNRESDCELWKTYERVWAWKQKEHPKPPSPDEGLQLREEVSQLRQRQQGFEMTVDRQQDELARLPKPRSLFNWSGPSQAELEARRQLIQENQQRLTRVKQKLKQSVQKLKAWQQQDEAFESWKRSPETQQMQESLSYLRQSEIKERLQNIAQGYEWFELGQKLAQQVGERDGKIRRVRGQTYFVESSEQHVLIMRNDKPIFYASDERKKGGIVQTFQMEMTENDKKIIQSFAKQVQERIQRQQQQRLQKRSPRRGMSL